MVDLDKFICSLLVKAWDSKSIGIRDIKVALKQQGLEYKEGAIKPIKEPVNFEEFPREEQLKWYICIKPIPQKDGGFMPLFCEGEHATIEKIFDMLPELKNDTALFTEHFRKVTEVELPKEKSSTESFDYKHADIPQKDFTSRIDPGFKINLPFEKDYQKLEWPPTIKFDEPDIEEMVEDFWHNKDVIISSHTRAMMEEAYRQGLEDMWNKLKSK